MNNYHEPGKKLTWEETVRLLQSVPDNKALLSNTYLDPDLRSNAERYIHSVEFKEIKDLLRSEGITTGKLLDVGAGNGICSVAFSKSGWEVTALEPDASDVTGRGAINLLKKEYSLSTLSVNEGTGESLPFQDDCFDVVFVRQAFHHAADLRRFVRDCMRVLRPGGILLGIREHVIRNEEDKRMFLEQHPMHKHYGGENAYLLNEYVSAFREAGGVSVKVIRYFDSPINYFPLSEQEVGALPDRQREEQEIRLYQLIGFPARWKWVRQLYRLWVRLRIGGPYDERRLPGRMYSFIVRKENHPTANG